MPYVDDGYGEQMWVEDDGDINTGFDNFGGTYTGYDDYSTGGTGWDSEGDWFGDYDTVDYSQYGQTEIENAALPGQPGYGWRYFSDGTVIDPSGKYYTNNPETGKTELVYDPASVAGGFMSKLLNTAKSAFTKPDGGINWAALATAGAALYNQFKDDKPGGYSRPVPKMEAVRQQVQYDDTNRRPGSGGRQYFTDTQYVPKGDAEALATAQGAATTQATGLRAAAPQQTAPAANPWAGKMNLAALKPAAASVETSNAAQTYPTIPEAQGLASLPAAKTSEYLHEQGPKGIDPEDAYRESLQEQQSKYVPPPHYITLPDGTRIEMPSGDPGGVTPMPVFVGEPPTLSEDQIQQKELDYAIKQEANPITNNVNLDSLADNLVQQTANTPQQQAQAFAKGGRYLSGKTDGMADKIRTKIDNKQAAALSHGEFVIPADVVSHLGNGNSDAGAQKLYDMMARIRKARTGTTKQGKKINPDKFMPGGLAQAYAAGGAVKKYDGTSGSAVVGSGAAGAAGAGGIDPDVSKTSTLSPWVGGYVTDALGQGAALAAQPYQAYQGPLTAGASGLQQQAFAGASELAQTGYTPSTYTTGTFDAAAASRYMNPYLSTALQPQIDEARRQAQIQNLQNRTAATKAGAFGGSRGALMESEGQRNMLQNIAGITGKGYQDAYTQAMNQFNTEQGRSMEAQRADEASRQFGANYARQGIDQLTNLGATQREIEQQGLAADKAQFEEQRDWAYKMPQYQLNLLQGLPIGAQTTSSDPGALAKMQTDIAGLVSLYRTLSNLGQTGGN